MQLLFHRLRLGCSGQCIPLLANYKPAGRIQLRLIKTGFSFGGFPNYLLIIRIPCLYALLYIKALGGIYISCCLDFFRSSDRFYISENPKSRTSLLLTWFLPIFGRDSENYSIRYSSSSAYMIFVTFSQYHSVVMKDFMKYFSMQFSLKNNKTKLFCVV